MKRILLASALLALAAPAHATTWYILDGSEAQCKEAAKIAPIVASPYVYENGSIFSVIVSSVRAGKSNTMGFFPIREDCELLLKLGLKKGWITGPSELK